MKKTMTALAVATVVGAAVLTAPTASAATGCTKNAHNNMYTCGAWGTDIQVHQIAGPGYAFGHVDAVNGKFPWVFCKEKGQTTTYGGYTNNWWLRGNPFPDWKFSGEYVSAIFLTQSANEPQGVPLC
jgi:hypothetical protein